MIEAHVFWNDVLAGKLTQFTSDRYEFEYDNEWIHDTSTSPISLTMPKSQKVYRSRCLFPVFFNLIAEGANRRLQSRQLRIDDKDYFGLLLATARTDTVGAITVQPVG